MCFRKINFRSCHWLQKYFYNEIFQIYGISPLTLFTSIQPPQMPKPLSFSWSMSAPGCTRTFEWPRRRLPNRRWTWRQPGTERSHHMTGFPGLSPQQRRLWPREKLMPELWVKNYKIDTQIFNCTIHMITFSKTQMILLSFPIIIHTLLQFVTSPACRQRLNRRRVRELVSNLLWREPQLETFRGSLRCTNKRWMQN